MKNKLRASILAAIILGLAAPGGVTPEAAVHAAETSQNIWEVYSSIDENGQDTGGRYIAAPQLIEGTVTLQSGVQSPAYLNARFDGQGMYFYIYDAPNSPVQNMNATEQLALSMHLENSDGIPGSATVWMQGGSTMFEMDEAGSNFVLEDMLTGNGYTVIELLNPNDTVAAYTFWLPHDSSFADCYYAVKDIWYETQPQILPGANGQETAPYGPVQTETAPLSQQWDWSKGHFNNGKMYIYTNNYITGTLTDPSGQTAEAYMLMYQDKDGFFVTLYDSGQNIILNTTEEDMTLQAQLIWYKGAKNEFRQDFTASSYPGTGVFRFPFSSTGYVRSTLQGAYGADPILLLAFPGGAVFRFILPVNTDYNNIWDALSSYWYIPTYNNDIYTGNEVHPDLITFLDKFEAAIYEELRIRQEAGTGASLANDFLTETDFNDELTAMKPQYMELENGLSRKVDSDYYAARKADIDRIMLNYSIDTASDLAQGGADLARLLGKDEWADLLETGVKIADITANIIDEAK